VCVCVCMCVCVCHFRVAKKKKKAPIISQLVRHAFLRMTKGGLVERGEGSAERKAPELFESKHVFCLTLWGRPSFLISATRLRHCPVPVLLVFSPCPPTASPPLPSPDRSTT